jgi:hypothetical protein
MIIWTCTLTTTYHQPAPLCFGELISFDFIKINDFDPLVLLLDEGIHGRKSIRFCFVFYERIKSLMGAR